MKSTNFKAFGTLVSAAFFLCLTLAFSINVAAQNTETRQMPMYQSVTTVTVKPEMMPQFEEAIKTDFINAFKKGGGKELYVWHMATGNTFKYIFVEPMTKLSEMGEPGAVDKGLGANAQAFWAKMSKMVDAVETEIVELKPNLSFMPEKMGTPKMAVVSFVEVAGDKVPMFEKFVAEDFVPVVGKSGVLGFHVHRMIFGGKSNTYIAVSFEPDYAAIDKGPPHMRVLKPEEAQKMFAKLPSDAIIGMETHIIHYHPEMSVSSIMQTAEK